MTKTAGTAAASLIPFNHPLVLAMHAADITDMSPTAVALSLGFEQQRRSLLSDRPHRCVAAYRTVAAAAV